MASPTPESGSSTRRRSSNVLTSPITWIAVALAVVAGLGYMWWQNQQSGSSSSASSGTSGSSSDDTGEDYAGQIATLQTEIENLQSSESSSGSSDTSGSGSSSSGSSSSGSGSSSSGSGSGSSTTTKVKVPNVVGFDVEQASITMQAAGLKASGPAGVKNEIHIVTSTVPAVGSSVDKGSTVTLKYRTVKESGKASTPTTPAASKTAAPKAAAHSTTKKT